MYAIENFSNVLCFFDSTYFKLTWYFCLLYSDTGKTIVVIFLTPKIYSEQRSIDCGVWGGGLLLLLIKKNIVYIINIILCEVDLSYLCYKHVIFLCFDFLYLSWLLSFEILEDSIYNGWNVAVIYKYNRRYL